MKTASLPTWNLKDLFKSEKDPKIKQIFSSCMKRAHAFESKYRGKLKPSPAVVLQAIREYESIEQTAVKPVHYASLLFAESASPAGRGAFLQYTKGEYVHIHNHLIFFEHELLKFPLATLKKLAKHPELKNYKHFLHNLILSKPHRLSVEIESILSDKSLTGAGAWIRLFDEELSFKKFQFTHKKKTELLSETAVLHKLYSGDRSERKAGAESLTAGLNEESRRLTYIFNTLSEDKAIDDRHRSYPSPEASRHLANEIDQKTVDIMSDVVTSYYGTVQDFYKYKKKVLKLPELFDYDRYAPVELKTKPISFTEAKKVVLDSFYAFSKEYGKIAEEFFTKGWIDATEREGKRGGAFCSFVTPDLHPYVFMNYHGTMREVFTLAHELGHAIHAYLMRGQSFLNFDTPLTIAETASVFAEMLLFEKLKTNIKDPKEKFALYVGKIESIFATVFRQIAMYRFEQDLHGARREQGELSTDAINAMWRKRQVEMFGKSVTLTAGYDCWWSYIPHFIHTPFYVYAYAFGELMTLALYAQYQKQGGSFVPKYMQLLADGGSKTPDELLKPLGIDLHTRSFWVGGMKVIESLVQELKSL